MPRPRRSPLPASLVAGLIAWACAGSSGAERLDLLKASELAEPEARAPTPDLPGASDPYPPPPRLVVAPEADGVVDAAAAYLRTRAEPKVNPFLRRGLAAPSAREVSLSVRAALEGPQPARASAVINGLLYSPGDRIEGMTIDSIGTQAIELRLNDLFLHVPAADRPVLLRLPPP